MTFSINYGLIIKIQNAMKVLGFGANLMKHLVIKAIFHI